MKKSLVQSLVVLVTGAGVATILAALTFPRPTPALVLGFALMGAEAGILLLCGEISAPAARVAATSLIFDLVVCGSYLLLNYHNFGTLPTNSALLFIVGFVGLAVGAAVGSLPKPPD